MPKRRQNFGEAFVAGILDQDIHAVSVIAIYDCWIEMGVEY